MNEQTIEDLLRKSAPDDSPSCLPQVRQQLAGGDEHSTPRYYTLTDTVGRGHFGTVFRAHDSRLDRDVALKIIRYDSAKQLLRLEKESHALARLSHPNIVSVYEKGIASLGTYYLAMEFIDGTPLGDWASAPRRTLREVLRGFAQAADGLQHAHSRGFIHRDFKPSNVLVDHRDRPQILDFGLVKHEEEVPTFSGIQATRDETIIPPGHDTTSGTSTDSNLNLTHRGSFVGTPNYASPEQLCGGSVGPASDQFSFCVTLFEAIYGYRPFRGRTPPELAEQIRHGVSDLRTKRFRVPGWLRKLLARGLSFHASDRYPDMASISIELDKRASSPLRTRVAYGTAGASLAAGIVAVAGYAFAPGPIELTWEGAWAGVERGEVEEKFGKPMLDHLDDYEQRWEDALNSYNQTASPDDESPQADCLKSSKERFHDFVELLGATHLRADDGRWATTADRTWLASLFDPRKCLLDSPPAPIDDEFLAQLLTAEQASYQGQYDRAIALLSDSRSALIERGKRGRLLGLVGYHLGTAQMHAGDPAAWATLRDAELDNGGDEDFLIDVLTRRLEAGLLGEVSAADRDALVAQLENRIERRGTASAQQRALLQIGLGHAAYARGTAAGGDLQAYDQARDHYQQARQLLSANAHSDLRNAFLISYCSLHESFMTGWRAKPEERPARAQSLQEAFHGLRRRLGNLNPLTLRFGVKVVRVLEQLDQAEPGHELIVELTDNFPLGDEHRGRNAFDRAAAAAERIHLEIALSKSPPQGPSARSQQLIRIEQALDALDETRVPGDTLYRARVLVVEAQADAGSLARAIINVGKLWDERATGYAREDACDYHEALVSSVSKDAIDALPPKAKRVNSTMNQNCFRK